MKQFAKIMIGCLVVLWVSCMKEDLKTMIVSPSAVKVDAAATNSTMVLDSAKAATTIATVVSWNAADFGAQLSVGYTLQVDSSKGTFAKPTEYTTGKELSQSFTKKAMNDLAQSLHVKPGVAGQIKMRVRSVVSANVEPVFSNTVTLTVTPYQTKPTPKFPVPDKLFIVGDATPGGWPNPVPTPTQELTRIDDNTFGIVLQLTGGAHYLLLPKNGDWSHKYAAINSGANATSDVFGPDAANDIPAPATTGLYKVNVDFVTGKYTLTSLTTSPVPDNLFIVGDATPGGWNNPVPVPSQQLTRISNSEFQVSIALSGGAHYLLLPVNGDWTHKYAVTNKNTANPKGDAFQKDASDDIPAPSAGGTYLVNVNFLTMKYKLTP